MGYLVQYTRKLNLLLLLMLFTLLNFGIYSQSAANYTPARSTGITFSTILGSGTAIASGSWRASSDDDSRTTALSIGFDFWYLGVKYTTFSVSTNGYVDLSSSTADGSSSSGAYGYDNSTFYGTSSTVLCLAPLYDDLEVPTRTSNSSVAYSLSGSAPNRVLTVEWLAGLQSPCADATCNTYNFQVKLNESTGVIEYWYGSMTGDLSYNCGLNGPTVSATPAAAEYLNQTTANTATFGTEQAYLTTVPESNTKIVFTPPTSVTAPTSLTFSSIASTSMTLNWTASSPTTNIIRYGIYNSTDNSTFTYVSDVALGVNTYAATGLSASTTYYWKVYAVTEGCLSTALTGTQATVATYTMGTSGSQSATVTATSGAPDKFYDNGGSGSNYSNSVDATYTFNCAGGKYVRMKLNSATTESTNDLIYVYDGTTTSDRLTGLTGRSGELTSMMYVSTTGSLTVRFVSNGSTTNVGWDMDVWIDDYAGQTWDGSSSTEVSTAANWEGSVLPFNKFSSIYIPSGLGNYPVLSNSSSPLNVFDMNVANGATFTYSSSESGHGLFVYGNITVDGTFTHSGNYYVQCEGGASDNYATISGSGTYSTMSIDIGYNRLAYYKLSNTSTISDFALENDNGNSIFDMNTYNLTTYYFDVESSTTFYQRTGTLSIEESASGIDNTSFNENTGTTIFTRAGSQTIPAIAYYNLSTTGAGTKTFAASTVDINGDLNIGSSSTLASGNFNMTVAGNWVNDGAFTQGTGTVTFDGTSTISGSTATSFYDVVISGTLTGRSAANFNVTRNWTNNGTYTHNSGTVTFNGAVAQTINGSSSTTFYNYTNENSSTGVTLGVNTTVNNIFTLTNGLFKTVSYTLTIGTSSTNGSISGGSSSVYIVAYDNAGTIGYVKQFVNSNAAYSYPIGDATNYTPLTFTLTANGGLSSAYLTIYTKDVKVPGLSSDFTAYLDRYWNVTESGFTTPTYDISYTYVTTDLVGSEDGMVPVKKSGSTWYRPALSSFANATEQGSYSFSAETNTLTWTGLSTFSGFGGVPDGVVTLPIALLSFTGEKDGRNNTLIWQTASEMNNDFFTVEKTTDGENYEIVGTEDGAGSSNQYLQYSLTDYAVREVINYYRLKQIDFDGKYTFSNVISIDNRANVVNKEVVLVTNILGQEVNEFYRGIVIIVYADGTSMKVIQ